MEFRMQIFIISCVNFTVNRRNNSRVCAKTRFWVKWILPLASWFFRSSRRQEKRAACEARPNRLPQRISTTLTPAGVDAGNLQV